MANSKDAHGLLKAWSQLRSMLVFVLHWLTKPASILNASEGRRARLLSWMLLFIFILTNATILILVSINPHQNPQRNEYIGFIFGLIILIVLAYGFNHTGKYYISAGMTVACAVIGP
jgi:drug/metabolite transporter (DMT)-like permease